MASDLAGTKFRLHRFSSLEISLPWKYRLPKKITFNQTSIRLHVLQKLVQFSHGSNQGKVGETPIENTRYGPGKTVSTILNNY